MCRYLLSYAPVEICVTTFPIYSQGYMHRCQAYPHLFSPEKIEAIFSNIVELLAFQKKFLEELESCIVPANMNHSQIGAVFLYHVSTAH